MKKIIFIIGFLVVTNVIYSQDSFTLLTVGMTGAQVRTALNNNFLSLSTLGVVNVKDYGAVGNGVTSDAVAVSKAMAVAISKNKTLYFPNGKYYLHGHTNINLTDASLKILGQGNAEVIGFHDESLVAGGWVVTSVNGANMDLDEDVNLGSQYIISSQISGSVAVNDLIHINSTELYCNNVYKGEYNKVLKVLGDTIVLVIKTRQNYELATTHVKKINHGKIVVENMKFKHWRIDLTNMTESSIINNSFYNCNLQPISAIGCYNLKVNDNYIIQDTITVSTGYGIGIASSENWELMRNQVYNYPQNIACGGFYSCRNGMYGYNKVANTTTNSPQAILDTHQGSESVKVIGNEVWGSIYCKGNDIDILNNHVFIVSSGTIGIERLIEQSEYSLAIPPDANYINIIGNVIRDLKDDFTGTFGIRVNQNSARDTIDFINVQGNYVKTGGHTLQIANEGHVSTYYRTLNIKDNYLESTDGSGQVIETPQININTVIIDNNTLIGKDTYTISSNATIENMVISNNIFKTDYWGIMNVSGITLLKVNENIFQGGSIIATNVPSIIIERNTFKDDLSNDPVWVDGTSNFLLVRENNYLGNIKTFRIDVLSLPGLIRDETFYYSGSLTDVAPSVTEVNGIVGLTAITARRGYKAVIKDTDGDGFVYKFESDGTHWIFTAPVRVL